MFLLGRDNTLEPYSASDARLIDNEPHAPRHRLPKVRKPIRRPKLSPKVRREDATRNLMPRSCYAKRALPNARRTEYRAENSRRTGPITKSELEDRRIFC